MGRDLVWGRKVLEWIQSGFRMKCPVDFSKLDPEKVEAERQKGARNLRGPKKAPSHFRPAIANPLLAGLSLDETTEDDGWVWSKKQGLSCISQVRGARMIKCESKAQRDEEGKEAAEEGASGAITLAFNPSGKLVAVDVFRRKLKAREASALMLELSGNLSKSLGRPTEAVGSLTEEGLSGTGMKTSIVNYRYQDSLVLLTAAHIPWSGGVAVHEQYSSIRFAN
jgi:hypothetical protein